MKAPRSRSDCHKIEEEEDNEEKGDEKADISDEMAANYRFCQCWARFDP